MRFLILSDIHANWEALTAVMADTRGEFDAILCLGDLVGYGPDPNAVVAWARGNVDVVIRGNHDKVCCGLGETEAFNPAARCSTDWTMSELSPQNRQWLFDLPYGPVQVESFEIVHGAPDDEDRYLFHVHDAEQGFAYAAASATFFGHTHIQGGFVREGRDVYRLDSPPDSLLLNPSYSYLINPGAVGQPRDGDYRAAYILYDSDRCTVQYRRVLYDVLTTQSKICDVGLPEALAIRLTDGH
jgi:predicted phosphodiesterase